MQSPKTITTWLILLALLTGGAFGQQVREVPRETVRASGEIKGVRRGLLAVLGKEGQQWLVKIDARPQDVSFVASADPNWLRRGMLVKFKNTFDTKGQPLASIRQLEVISPRDDTQLGLIPASSLGGASNLFSAEDTQKKQAPQSKSFTVVGRLQALKDDRLLVVAGRTPVSGKLDEQAKISVNVSDYSLAAEGDAIEIVGWRLPGREDQIYATRITITSKRRLGQAAEKDTSKSKAKSKPNASKQDVEKSLEELFSPSP